METTIVTPVVQEAPVITPRAELMAALVKAQAALAQNQAAIAKAEQDIQTATDLIELAPDALGAQDQIDIRYKASALLAEYLKPQAAKLQAAVAEKQAAVRAHVQQDRINQLSKERESNQNKIKEADDALLNALGLSTGFALEIASRYALLKSQVTEISGLMAAGAMAPTTDALPAIQTVAVILDEMQKFGTLEWIVAPKLKKDMENVPAWNNEVKQ